MAPSSGYRSFDAAEWRLSQCRRRLAGMDFDSACDRASRRMAESSRWSSRFESGQDEVRILERRLAEEGVDRRLQKKETESGDSRRQRIEMEDVRWRATGNRKFFETTTTSMESAVMGERVSVEQPGGWKKGGPVLGQLISQHKAENVKEERDGGEAAQAESAADEESEYTYTYTSNTPSESGSEEEDLETVEELPTDDLRPAEKLTITRHRVAGAKYPVAVGSVRAASVKVTVVEKKPAMTTKVSVAPPPTTSKAAPPPVKARRSSAATNATSGAAGANLKRRSLPAATASQQKLDFLEAERERSCRRLDSLVVTIQKWVQAMSAWDVEPLSKIRCQHPVPMASKVVPTDPYPTTKGEIYTYVGETNDRRRPHGAGTMTFENGDRFCGEFRDEMRQGPGTLELASSSSPSQMLYLDGNYADDRLEGRGKIEYRDGSVLYAWFEAGTLHGFGKLYDKGRRLLSAGWYEKGRLAGFHWLFLEGGGCLVGEADKLGNMSGENVAFLFPDYSTAIVGTFSKTKMYFGQVAFIQTVSIKNEMCHIRFTSPRGPLYNFDPGTRESICKEPLLPDPYETLYCYIAPSKIKGAKEGIFAKRDLPEGFVVAFYNGLRMRSDELDADKDDWEANAYKIMDMLEPTENGVEGVLDIPPECVSLRRYRASLAHKANHSFQPNAKFALFHHPRFGRVPALRTLTEVARDAEVLVSYDYALDDAPPWYQELFTKRIISQYQKTRSGWNC